MTASYPGVVGGVDVKVRPDAEGFAQQIVIAKRPTGPLSFTFPLRLAGLHARMGAKGLVEFLDAAGRVVLRSSPGRAAGAQTDTLTDEPIKTAPVTSRLVTTAGGGQALEVAPDPSFLRDAHVEYPVTIDSGAIALAAPVRLSRSAGARPSGSAGPQRSRSAGARPSGSAQAVRSLASPASSCSDYDCPPTNVVATAFNEKLDVTWDPPAGGYYQHSYTVSVYRASDGSLVASKAQDATSTQASFTFKDGIVNGEGYYVGVYATTIVGDLWLDTSSSYSATVTPAAVPWSQLDTLGGANPSEPAVTCRSSWGVDCGTGNFSWSHTDLSVPGRGIALGLTTTYNSQDPRRWTTNYDMRVEMTRGANGQPDAAIVHQENGSTVYFFDDGRGGWHAEGGAQATLVNNPLQDETTIPTLTFRRTHALTSFVFDASGALLSESDRNGYTTTLSYNANGHLSRVTDPAGRSLSFQTNAQGKITQATDPAGRQVSFVYDATGYLVTQLTDAGGGATTFSYAPEADPAHPQYHLIRVVSPNANARGTGSGNVVTNAYDGTALSSETGGTGRTMFYAYDTPAPAPGTPSTNTTTITDPNGHVVVARHTNYLLSSITRGSGSAQQTTSSFAHDPLTMQTTSTTDPRGHVWASTFDASANLLTRTDPLGRRTAYTYDARNQPLTETDPLGVTTSYAYDASENLTSVARPLTGTGQTQRTTYAYDPGRPGDLTGVTDPNAKTSTSTYDANGNRASQTDPLGDRKTFAYDPVGRLTSSVSPRGNAAGATPAAYTTRYAYDALDDLTSVTDPLGDRTTLAYDPNQNLTARTDPNGHRTSYAYDRFDEPTTVTRPDGTSLVTGYDNAGNVTSQIDPAGEITTYGYDALNRRTSETDPLGRTRGYTYDPTGNRTALTDPAAKTTSYGYDDANQLTSVAYSDNRTPGVAYGYDGDGQRTSMRDGSGQSSYAYDSLHRLVRHSDGGAHAVSYGYDLNGQATSIAYPSALGGGGGTVTRGYDDAGRLSSVGDWLGHTTRFGYDPDSQLTSQAYPNGASATQAYDNADRLTSIADASPAAGQFLNLPYGRDPAGQLSSEGAKTLAYDQNNRLKTQSAAPAVTYGYDRADNPTSATITGGASKTMSYDQAHQLTTMTTTGPPTTTTNYAYDLNGNRTSDGITPGAYAYDQANRLTGYLTSTTYAYDGDGLRTNKTGLTGAEPYTWDTAAPLPEIIGDATTAYVTGPGGLPLEQITSSGDVHYYHQDQLGSTRAITDQTGNVAATSTYDPYGNPVSQTGTLPNPFGYAGQYTDPETGLQYLRARYYDPQTQNFLTRDPLTPTTRTPYTYTNNTPTTTTDPTGLQCSTGGQDGGPGGGTVEPTAAEVAWPGFYMPGLVYIPTLDDLFSAIKAGVGDPLHNPLDALALIPPLKALRGIGILARAVGIGEKAARGGETAAAAYGRAIHQAHDYGPGFVKEFRGLPSGGRPDAVNFGTREVVELKPNNPAAIAQGERQAADYARQLGQEFPGTPFTHRVQTYDRP